MYLEIYLKMPMMVEIKDALEIIIKLHLKMDMVMHFLGHKSAQNDSVKR